MHHLNVRRILSLFVTGEVAPSKAEKHCQVKSSVRDIMVWAPQCPLSHYFPSQQRFLIKPQSEVRDEQDVDISFSSIQVEFSLVIDDPLPVVENSFSANLAADTSMMSTSGLVTPGSGSIYIPVFVTIHLFLCFSH